MNPAIPNDMWIQSPNKPEWALCFDESSLMYMCKCKWVNDSWVMGDLLTAEEIYDFVTMIHFGICDRHREAALRWLEATEAANQRLDSAGPAPTL